MPVADESNRELQLLEPNDFDQTELTPTQSRTSLAAWYLLLAAAILAIAIVLLSSMQAEAVVLTISAQVSGQGNMSSSYMGDSLNVILVQNAAGLNISVVGGAT
jgi:hypothetical protein